MQYKVAIDPQLDLSADEFVEAWNAGEHTEGSIASVDKSPPESYLPLEVAVALITAAVSIPATVVADYVSEYLKKKFLDKDDLKVTVTTIQTPDGQTVLIIEKGK
jgi:hypothetical protein